MDVEGAARALGVGRSMFYQLLQRGQIQSVKVGRRRLVPSVAIQEFVQRLREEQTWVSDAERDSRAIGSPRTTGYG